MKTDSRAALKAAKLKCTETITAVDEAAVHAAADCAALDVWESQWRELKDRRAAAVAACQLDDVIAITTKLSSVEVSIECATGKAEASKIRHTDLVEALAAAEKAFSAAITAAYNTELITDAEEFVQMLDVVMAKGEQLRLRSGWDPLQQPLNAPPVALPVEVMGALARLPLRDQLRVPMDVLRGAGEISNARAQRLTELRSDADSVFAA